MLENDAQGEKTQDAEGIVKAYSVSKWAAYKYW